MKVTMMALEYPPNIYGGVGIHLKYLTKALLKFMEVEVRTIGSEPPTKIDGVPVKYFSPWKAMGDVKERHGKVLETLSLCLALVAEPIDGEIVHTHTWYTNLAGLYAKKLYGKKLLATVHSLEPLRPWKAEQIGSGYNLSVWMEKTGLEECDRIIAVSEEMKKDIQEVYGIPGNRISVIHNGIDIEKYRKQENEGLLRNLGVRKPYILFVGRLTRQKGIFELVEAMKEVRATLVLVTGKPDTPEIEGELAVKLKGMENIIWLNRMLSETEIIALYSSARLFVCPSIYEPFGIINLEAMACGAPVVASAVGGIKEVIQDGKNGVLVEPGNVEALAEAINRVLADDELRERLIVEGRRRAEEFAWERIARKTYLLYREVLGA
ncbi:MAG: glycogen synthase [Thermoplasmata archaeon]|nr:glycogen synthase [Thermoplasmata archaeon]